MVLCECNNLAVVVLINKGSARVSTGLVMHMLRVCFLFHQFLCLFLCLF